MTMIVSSRREPFKSAIRRAPTPSNIRVAPLTLRVPFIDSPLPSPSLPTLFSRRVPKSSRWRTWRFWRRIGLIISCFIATAWLISPAKHFDRAVVPYESNEGDPYEIVGTHVLPDIAGPLMIQDEKGRARWTILIPPSYSSPLRPSEYATMCMEAGDLATHVSQTMHNKLPSERNHGFHHSDKSFLDVMDAQKMGLLPNPPTEQHTGTVVGVEHYEKFYEMPLCEKSLTFILQADDAGLGPVLLGLWMAYGFAREEKRAFFIDDSDWAYGKYTSYFHLPPMPSCRPPPDSLRIPGPVQARHLLVSPSTFRWIFDSSFNQRFESRHKIGVDRQKQIFSFARAGYEALFHLQDQDEEFYTKSIRLLQDKDDEFRIGIHVRHGDRHPWEFQYENSYIPLDKYTKGADELAKSMGSWFKDFTLAVASDDPDVYSAPELNHALKAQSFISLSSQSTLDSTFIDKELVVGTNSGWQGGFFNNIFWSLGSPSSRPVAENSPPPSKYPSSPSSDQGTPKPVTTAGDDNFRFNPPSDALRLRSLVARSYLLDLAVLGSSDGVVCGISSASCRLLGVMLGWEKAIKQQRWKNVDGSMHWQGFIW